MIAKAAIRYANGDMYTEYRHYLCVLQAKQSGKHERTEQFEEGFVTAFGTFLSRDRAKIHALRSGQITTRHRGALHSEDLWPQIQLIRELAARTT